MPGKYSHSVVLADYSSRGIINLPNDQHVAYLKTVPYSASQFSRKSSTVWSEPSSAPQHRSQSAMAYSNYHMSQSSRDLAGPQRVLVDALAPTIDSRPSNLVPQRPSTSDNAKVSGGRRHPSTSRQVNASTHVSTTLNPISADPVSNKPLPNTQQVTRTYSSIPSSASTYRKPASTVNAGKHQPSPSAQPVRQLEPSAISAKLEPVANIKLKSTKSSSETKNTAPAQAQAGRISHTPHASRSQQHPSSPERQRDVPVTHVDDLNFEGFSDSEDQPQSYFTKPTDSQPTRENAIASAGQPSSRFQTPSPRRAPSRTSDFKAKSFRPISTEPPDSELLTDVGASPLHSVGKLNSLTSVSTVGSKEAAPAARTTRHVDTKKSTTQSSVQDWRLPEISEDGAFGPDFFSQGPEDVARPQSDNGSVDSFLNRPLGTISAGRDVDFSQVGDEDSEADAACPPDIGRFRQDDEPESSVYFQTPKTDGSVGKNTGFAGQASKGRKIGFLARLRSKSRS